MPEKFWILNERDVHVCTIQDGNRPHMIQLKLPWEHLELSLSSTEELQDWLQVVQGAIQYKVMDVICLHRNEIEFLSYLNAYLDFGHE